MIAKGRSPEAQAARLAAGCCPVHGTSCWGQVAGWFSSITRHSNQLDDYTLGACPRSDCDVVVKMTRVDVNAGREAVTVVTAVDVHPEMWAQAAAWLAHKRARGPK